MRLVNLGGTSNAAANGMGAPFSSAWFARGERVFVRVLAVGLAAAGGAALIVASCLDHSSTKLDEPGYVETTSARSPTETTAASGSTQATQSNDSNGGPSAGAPPATVVVPAPPVNITVNNEPTGTTTVTRAEAPVAGHASHAANDPAQNPNLVQRAPLVAPDALVSPGLAPNYTPAPYGSSYATVDAGATNTGGGAGDIGSGGGPAPATSQTPSTPPTSATGGAPSPFTTDWGPMGSGYVTPNPNMGAGAFSSGNTPR